MFHDHDIRAEPYVLGSAHQCWRNNPGSRAEVVEDPTTRGPECPRRDEVDARPGWHDGFQSFVGAFRGLPRLEHGPRDYLGQEHAPVRLTSLTRRDWLSDL